MLSAFDALGDTPEGRRAATEDVLWALTDPSGG